MAALKVEQDRNRNTMESLRIEAVVRGWRMQDEDRAMFKADHQEHKTWEREDRNSGRVQYNIQSLNDTGELRKDATAARLGITRGQYEQLQESEGPWRKNTGWNN